MPEAELDSRGNRQSPIGFHAVLGTPTPDGLEGGIYIIRRPYDQPERLDHSDRQLTQWQIAWIPEAGHLVASAAEVVLFTPLDGSFTASIDNNRIWHPRSSSDSSAAFDVVERDQSRE